MVVDNNSTDDTPKIARRLGARVVFEPVNQIARARNRGGEAARGRYIIFIDADTTAPRELIEAALAELAGGRTCGGGTIVGTSDRIATGARQALRHWNSLSQRFRWAAGSFVFCRRDGWDGVGGFDLRVYAGEELLFSHALRRWGRARGQEFKILTHPVDTSMRKLEWYTPWQLQSSAVCLLLCPWLLRSRRFCRMWYDRPGSPT